jgi:hypothetical protein
MTMAGLEENPADQVVILLSALETDPMLTERKIQLKEEMDRGTGPASISEVEERVTHFLRVKKLSMNAQKNKQERVASSVNVTCYNCGGMGHYARNCSKPQKPRQPPTESPAKPQVNEVAGDKKTEEASIKPAPSVFKNDRPKGQGKPAGKMQGSMRKPRANQVADEMVDSFLQFKFDINKVTTSEVKPSMSGRIVKEEERSEGSDGDEPPGLIPDYDSED